jgi:predicted nucleotidyltransferase
VSDHREAVIALFRDRYVPLALAELTEKGAIVDRIVLYGSYAYGTPHADSDIDIAIICHGKVVYFNDFDIVQTLHKGEHIDGIDRRIQSAVFRHEEIERFRKFPLTIYSKIVTAGIVLWENPESKELHQSTAAPMLSALEAKAAFTTRWLSKAKSLLFSNSLGTASTWRRQSAARNAYTAACFSLWAILYNAGIDPSPHPMRWRIRRLFELANWTHTELSALRKLLRWLPEKFDVRRCDWEYGVTKKASKRARVASILFYRKAREFVKENRS